MGPDGPKWGQKDFFLLIQTLPTFWAERIWVLRISIFEILWIPISEFPGSQISKIWPGPSQAGLGPWAGLALGGQVGFLAKQPSYRLLLGQAPAFLECCTLGTYGKWHLNRFAMPYDPAGGIRGTTSFLNSAKNLG